MWNKKLLTVIRYSLLLIIMASIVMHKNDIDKIEIVFVLIFIINNQLRFFSLDKISYRSISFIVELAMIIFCYKYIGGYLFGYLVLLALDSNILFKNPIKTILNVLITFEGIMLSLKDSLDIQIMNMSIVIILILILYFINDEYNKKIEAQELYDKLRISEDKLKKANNDLEMYASSIEEITLLRERNRLSREIHDSVGHALSTIIIQLGAIEKVVDKNPTGGKQLAANLREFTQKSLNDVRGAVREIKPKEFENYEGIIIIDELINKFKKLTGVDVRLSFTKEKWALNSDQTFVIYRIIQEFLSNSLRHGKSTVIKITMAFNEYSLIVALKDNGIGKDKVIEGLGLRSMRERVEELGGAFDYSTKPNDGFLVRIELDKKEKLKIYSQEEES